MADDKIFYDRRELKWHTILFPITLAAIAIAAVRAYQYRSYILHSEIMPNILLFSILILIVVAAAYTLNHAIEYIIFEKLPAIKISIDSVSYRKIGRSRFIRTQYKDIAHLSMKEIPTKSGTRSYVKMNLVSGESRYLLCEEMTSSPTTILQRLFDASGK